MQSKTERTERIIVCLSRDRTPFSYVTWLADGGGFTHASLGLSEEAEYYYSFNFKGLKKEYRTSLKKRPREMQRYVIKVTEDAHRKLEEIIAEMEREKDRYQYAKLGVSLRLLRVPTEVLDGFSGNEESASVSGPEDDPAEEDKYYCSQFVAAVLKASGCVNIQTPPAECTPNDLKRELEESGQILLITEESEMQNPGEALLGKAAEQLEKGRDQVVRHGGDLLEPLMDKALDKLGDAKDAVAEAPEKLAKLTGGLLRKTPWVRKGEETPETSYNGSRRHAMEEKKTIRVTAAIIHQDGKILATQRGYGDYKDWWEFPGGKIEPGETPEDCIVREIREELAAEIAVEKLLCTVEWEYPKFHLSMDCFLCHVAEGELTLLEHEASRWLTRDEADDVHWLPSDLEVISLLKEDWPEEP